MAMTENQQQDKEFLDRLIREVKEDGWNGDLFETRAFVIRIAEKYGFQIEDKDIQPND